MSSILLRWQKKRRKATEKRALSQSYHSRPLTLTRDAQLDTVLPFLRAAPSGAFLTGDRDIHKRVILRICSKRDSPANESIVRTALHELARLTIKHHIPRDSVQQTSIEVNEILERLEAPLCAIVVFDAVALAGKSINRAANTGCYGPAPEIPCKTPTEVLAALLDDLDAAQQWASTSQRAIFLELQKLGEASRLHCEVDVASIKSLLVRALNYPNLEDSSITARIRKYLEDMNMFNNQSVPLTRLLDNMYGRVWETSLGTALVDKVPQKVLETASVMRRECVKLIKGLPSEQHANVCRDFSERLAAALPRPWSAGDERLQRFTTAETIDMERVELFFQSPTRTGREVMGDYFVGAILFETIKLTSALYFDWNRAARERYFTDITPLKGQQKFADLSTAGRHGWGLTLAHHIPVDVSGPASLRPALLKTWDLDESRAEGIKTANMRAIEKGVPVVTGMSGFMHLFTSFALDIRSRECLDLPNMILGLLTYLVVDGGHSWNECLQTVNYLEHKLAIGILDDVSDYETFVADYADFFAVFRGTSTEGCLRDAIEHAHRATILYRRKLRSSGLVTTPVLGTI